MNGKGTFKNGYVFSVTLMICVTLIGFINLLWKSSTYNIEKDTLSFERVDRRIFRMEEFYRWYYNEPCELEISPNGPVYKVIDNGKAYYYKYERKGTHLKVIEYHGQV